MSSGFESCLIEKHAYIPQNQNIQNLDNKLKIILKYFLVKKACIIEGCTISCFHIKNVKMLLVEMEVLTQLIDCLWDTILVEDVLFNICWYGDVMLMLHGVKAKQAGTIGTISNVASEIAVPIPLEQSF